jgi:starvation-inducible DNA-binding protein
MATAPTANKVASVQKILNKQVANWGLLYVKFHNFHWYVKGTEFFSLHIKFEELYNQAHIYLDELAERLLAIEGKPYATMKEYLAESSLKEAKGSESAQQMIQGIVADCEMLLEELDESMKVAEEAEDETTVDLLLEIHAALEKQRWMFKAYLGQ